MTLGAKFKLKRLLAANVDAVEADRASFEDRRREDVKAIRHIARFFGTTTALYIHLAFYGFWLSALTYFAYHYHTKIHLDSIGTAASLEAIVLAIFVLINQTQQSYIERKNADLHLQMSLLTDKKVTQVARLIDQMAKEIGIIERSIQFDIARSDTNPKDILSHLSEIDTHAVSTAKEMKADH